MNTLLNKYVTCLLLGICPQYVLFCQQGCKTFTNPGTFTVPAGVTQLSIEVQALGGYGGSYGGGGGGGGGFAMGVYTVVPGSTIAVGASWYDTLWVKPFLYAVKGGNGRSGYASLNPGKGGAGGVAWGGNLMNSYGGEGGSGSPFSFGGGGGGAGGINGNGFNGANAPAAVPNATWAGSAGGNGGGGLAGKGGTGAVMNYYSANLVGQSFGGGGGGGYSSGSGNGSGGPGYCHFAWGPCYIPPVPYTKPDAYACRNQPATLTAVGYDNLIWISDTVSNSVIASGRNIQTFPLTKDTAIFLRSSTSCGMSRATRIQLHAMAIPTVVATVKPLQVCYGSNYTLSASGAMYFNWSNGSYFQSHVVTNTLTTPVADTLKISVEGNWYYNDCPDYDTVTVVLRSKTQYNCVSSKTNSCKGDTIQFGASGAALSGCYWINGATGFTTSMIVGSFTNYCVTLTDTNNCSLVHTFAVRDLTPDLKTFASPSISCKGEPVNLVAIGASTYTWSSGYTGNLVTVYPEESFTYSVTGSSMGCSSTASLYHEVQDCTGLNEVTHGDFSVYPNPSEGKIFITNAVRPITIRDLYGAIIFVSISSEGEQTNIQLPAGVYFISSGNTTKKLIIAGDR